MSQSVFLINVPAYDASDFDDRVARLLDAAGFSPAPGTRVLVKPNLVAPRQPGLSCTHPRLVRAACRYLLHLGTRPVVGDSPAFGTAGIIARLSGLRQALADLPVKIVNLDDPRPVRLSLGGVVGVSRLALTAEVILNLPRLKAHDQMGLTLGVKNLFGCVSGFRKSVAHQVHGEKGDRFPRLILDVMAALPPRFTLLDGITAMHRHGPVGGEAFDLGLLAAAPNPVALDTAVYAMLGVGPDLVPLWRVARDLGLPGSDPSDLAYPLSRPEDFDARGFVAPTRLDPVAFEFKRFVTGRIKSVLTRLKR